LIKPLKPRFVKRNLEYDLDLSRGAALDAVRNALREHQTSDGVTLNAGVLIIWAVRA